MKKRTKVWIILLVLIAVLFIAGSIAMNLMQNNLDAFVAERIKNISLDQATDGTYEGAAKVLPVSVVLQVDIKQHRITDIRITKHFNGQGAPAEKILGKVIDAQSLEVDVVSGATYSSKVILQAIADALEKAE